MAEVTALSVFGRLNRVAYDALDRAATHAKQRGHPAVEVAHWLMELLGSPDSDVHAVARHFGLDREQLDADLRAAVGRLPRGSTGGRLEFSPEVESAMKEAFFYAELLYRQSKVRGAHLLVALTQTPGLLTVLPRASREFRKIKPDELRDRLDEITSSSPESKLAESSAATPVLTGAAGAGGAGAPAGPGSPLMGRQEALAKFSDDLTEKARAGKLDPVVGRDAEVRQIIDILMRRRQNNPILTGEAGVGKTAVVEGFAARVAAGDVPPALREVSVRTLDLGLLQAGASMKGEFEQRLRQLIEEVQGSPKPIILFIDEAHTLIGAGGAEGQGDAANLLKPALARGTLRTIAATTWAEYKKYFEKDPALTRRFQVVKVDEPDEAKTVRMLRGVAATQEKHHKVLLLDEALEAAVRLSHRYIPARQLPDKAVSLLDTACARVATSQHGTPATVEDSRRRIEAIETELGIVGREAAVGVDHAERTLRLRQELEAERQQLAALEARWKSEQELVERVLDLRARLRDGAAAPAVAGDGAVAGVASGVAASGANGNGADDIAGGGGGGDPAGVALAAAPATGTTTGTTTALASVREEPGPSTASTATAPAAEMQALAGELAAAQAQLAELQGEDPLILPAVDAQAVAAVVADWTGIPVGRMVKNEIQTVLRLADSLERRVIGQRHALDAIAKRIQTSRAGLDNPTRPVGVFLLAGPSGVGKTETALALAEALYGGEQNVITINMSEFQESHTVSTLKGAPPGYVGYGEGGILTEAVRRRPYSVVLLDEVEKAHSDVHELFFQVFDKGRMEDGQGRMIDFKNTIILLTSNVGSDLIMNLCKDPELSPAPEGIAKALREPLLKVFPAALLGRLVVVPYHPISDAMLRSIIRLQLGRVARRVEENHGVPFSYDDAVVDLIASRCTETQSGARAVDAIITHTILPEISREFLVRMAAAERIGAITVGVQAGAFSYGFRTC